MTHCAESKENVKQPKREFFSLLEIADCELCLTGYLSHYIFVFALRIFVVALRNVVVIDSRSSLIVLQKPMRVALDTVSEKVLPVVALSQGET
jgi:hypothetical protein